MILIEPMGDDSKSGELQAKIDSLLRKYPNTPLLVVHRLKITEVKGKRMFEIRSKLSGIITFNYFIGKDYKTFKNEKGQDI